MKDKPILSICIPTYNRAESLRKSLESIVNQQDFTNAVEVIISDNMSTDATKKVAEFYCNRYKNIKYYRNNENVADKNFSLALQRATGVLRKLSNDTLIYRENSIKYILDAVCKNIEKKPVLFFMSSGVHKTPFLASELDTFLNYVSYYITGIASFSIWDDDCMNMDIFDEKVETHLAQVSYLLQCVEMHGNAMVYDRILFDTQMVEKKDLSYGVYNVFYKNFMDIISIYYRRGLVSLRTFENVKKDVLLRYFAIWVAKIRVYPNMYILGDEDLDLCIRNTYIIESYYNQYKWNVMIRIIKEYIHDLKRRLRRSVFKR